MRGGCVVSLLRFIAWRGSVEPARKDSFSESREPALYVYGAPLRRMCSICCRCVLAEASISPRQGVGSLVPPMESGLRLTEIPVVTLILIIAL